MKPTSVLIAFYCFLAGLAQAQNPTSPITLENTFTAASVRFTRPIEMVHAGDGSGRIFVAYQNGMIRIFRKSAPTVVTTFLNLTNRTQSSGEEGLLGLAFDPNYRTNGYFYVNHTSYSPKRNSIVRYKVSATNPDKADSLSNLTIIEFNQPYANHNGGRIEFGLDGYLYIASGDGGSGNDPQSNAQNLKNLLGKVLRIDVRASTLARPYTIPPTNPYFATTFDSTWRKEIWCYGLRNPWKISQDKLTGRWWAGDVGQNAVEEIDTLVKGGNYGWRKREGHICTPAFADTTGCNNRSFIGPVSYYTNRNDPGGAVGGGNSVTGGFVYRGQSCPAIYGKYIYADYTSGNIWAISFSGSTTVDQLIYRSSRNISAFGVDEDNELYVVEYGGGNLYRIKANPNAAQASKANMKLSLFPNPANTSIQFRTSQAINSSATIKIYSIVGDEVFSMPNVTKASGSPDTFNVNTASLPNGTYIYNLAAGTYTFSGRLVVKH